MLAHEVDEARGEGDLFRGEDGDLVELGGDLGEGWGFFWVGGREGLGSDVFEEGGGSGLEAVR
jgi:hypothetical protein